LRSVLSDRKKKRKTKSNAPASLADQAIRQTVIADVTTSSPLIGSTEHKESPEQRSGSFIAKFAPEASILLSLTWTMFTPAHWWQPGIEALWFGIQADVVMLMASCTLIDIASRLRCAPPWWIAPFAALGLLLLTPGLFGFVAYGFELSWLIIAPFLWSVVERLRELWTLPTATTLEKIRRRTLTFDRLYVGVIIAVSGMVFGFAAYMVFDIELSTWINPAGLWIVWGFYAISCYNVWRVHRAAFANRPRSLLPKWMDQGDSTYLNAL
jgi:hypothetical protein